MPRPRLDLPPERPPSLPPASPLGPLPPGAASIPPLFGPQLLIARPLAELGAHICHWQLPSWELVARAIKVLVLGIFRGHLFDEIMLLEGRSIRHSLQGRVQKETIATMEEKYPHMVASAVVLQLQPGRILSGGIRPRLDGGEMSADTVRNYFYNLGVELTPKVEGNTLKDILDSSALTRTSLTFD